MRRFRALLLWSFAAAPVAVAGACAPLLDFDALTSGGGSKTDGSALDAASDTTSLTDAGSDSPGDGSSTADAIEEYSANPCGNVPSVYDGVYCGKSNENGFCCGAPNTLYSCVDGSVSRTTQCSPDCITDPMGVPDTCDECSTKHDGKWCGSEFFGYDPLLKNVVFTCQAGVEVDMPTPTACTGAQPNCKPNDGGATCVP
jgi:hypothetical protein